MTDLVGKVRQISDKTIIEWKINNFIPMMLQEPGTSYNSPHFTFSDTLCYLTINPNGKKDKSEGYVGLYLCLKKHKNITCATSLKSSTGCLEYSLDFTIDYKDAYGHGWPKFCKISELMKRNYELLPAGVLTIHCKILREGFRLVAITRFQRYLTICSRMKKMLTEQKNTDVVFKFQERQIRAHRMILKSGSEYFETMFEQDMVENREGIVTIDDIEPDVFQLVLSYIYCGEVEELSTINMCQLFSAANKYLLTDLKKMCATFMEENMSEDLFCDVLAIADIYNETELMQFCKEFFMLNSKSIIKTEMWKNFYRKNMEVAFKLLLSVIEENDLKKPEI